MNNALRNKVIAFALILPLSATGTDTASASQVTSLHPENLENVVSEYNEGDVHIDNLEDGGIAFREGNEEVIAYYNKDTGFSTLIDSDGNEHYYPVFNGGGAAFRDGGIKSFSCTMLLWAIDVVRGEGWARAINIISKAGWQGKAIAAAMWTLGSSGFLAAVSSKC